MKATNIAFTGIPVTDMKRARAFYEGPFGLQASGEFAEGVWVEYEIDSPVCRMAVVQDPDGDKIIIHKLKRP